MNNLLFNNKKKSDKLKLIDLSIKEQLNIFKDKKNNNNSRISLSTSLLLIDLIKRI